MIDYPDPLLRSLRELSQLMVAEETLDQTLDRVATLTCMSLDGCDFASVTLESPSLRTAACTDPAALAIDEAQYEADGGPCLHALRTQTIVEVPSITEEPRWQLFGRRAGEHGVQSSMSLPLVVGGEGRGAFNLYARKSHAFSETDRKHGELFAEQGAVAISNSAVYWRTYELTQDLQTALENRDVIGQAKGILMATRGLTADAAFDELRRVSQRRNVKLREIANIVAFTGELPKD